jgi:hypothetical protein
VKVRKKTALIAILLVVATAAITGSFRLPPLEKLPRCLDSALIAFETAQSPDETLSVWKQLNAARPNLAKGLYADFGFIAAYTFLFLTLALLIRERPVRFARTVSGLAMAAAIATGVADLGENCFALKSIAALEHGVPESGMILLMRAFSLTKWTACGVTLVLLWWAFVPARRGSALYRLLTLLVGGFSVLSGALGILGHWDNSKIELVIPFLLPALLLQIPLFWFFWDDVTGVHEHHASQALAKGDCERLVVETM